ncbi:hypothetical protein [Actinomadura roseirufa]|uniref:hypothetical protein n=1 Tax=Actinomadura roseirufa TaxID=2094049 RepID=UPI0010418664|nr:hypothetical protein [Actinomadura roseirufa]
MNGTPGGEGELTGAASGARGYVVVGFAGSSALAWRSDDLTRWTAGSGDLKDAEMHDVTAVDGGYVAVGQGKNGTPAAWTSPDGEKWTAVSLPPGTAAPTRVVARGAVVVAAGAGAAVAVSSDAGRTWRSQPVQAAEITAALATPRGFVLAGTPSGTSDTGLWTSPDGVAWRPVRPHGRGLDGAGAQRLTGLAPLGGGVLTTGTDDAVPTLWRTSPP